MADTKISELPVATAIASPDVAPIVQGGVTKQADISLFAGSILSANVARVDPSGDDGIGAVGDLSKPFLTVQGAIDAIEAGSFGDYPVIDIGNNVFTEDITTSLTSIQFVGTGQPNQPFNSITFTEPSNPVIIYLSSINVCAELTPAIYASSADSLQVYVSDSYIGPVSNSGGSMLLYGFGDSGIGGPISAPGQSISSFGIPNLGTINSSGSSIVVRDSRIGTLTAAASISLTDARIATNNAGIIPTYSDVLLANPIFPDSDPHIAGAGYWVAGALVKSIG